VPELAASVSADEDSLRRLLHARATVGVYEERDVWAYRESHPESNAVFNDNMTALNFHVAHAVAEAYDFSGLSRVVDAGGGQGACSRRS
jgi:O-methyltransferase domain